MEELKGSCDTSRPTESELSLSLVSDAGQFVQISAHCEVSSWSSDTVLAGTGIPLSPSPQFLNGAKDLQQLGTS